jgi:molybdenum-dependent DNA-binding transcriptional regulator ModE
MARKTMCDRCPRRDASSAKRDMARLFRALGDDTSASEMDDRAREMDMEGCPAWWAITEQNSSNGTTRVREQCGVEEALPAFLTDLGGRIVEAMQTASSVRDAVSAGLSSIAHAVGVARAINAGSDSARRTDQISDTSAGTSTVDDDAVVLHSKVPATE